MWREYFLGLLASSSFTQYLKHDLSVPDAEVTAEYCARHNWLVGSPQTVAEKLKRLYDQVGGFGTVLMMCYDYSEHPQVWNTSMRLFAEEVMPRFASLVPGSAVAVG